MHRCSKKKFPKKPFIDERGLFQDNNKNACKNFHQKTKNIRARQKKRGKKKLSESNDNFYQHSIKKHKYTISTYLDNIYYIKK